MKRKLGRPIVKVSIEEMQQYARTGATYKEIAQRMGIGHATLEKRLEQPIYREAMDQARAEMYLSLRATQVKLAMAGNVTMLIWLGKQYLGQKDKHELSGTGTNGAIEVTMSAAERLERRLVASSVSSPAPRDPQQPV